MEVKFPEPVGVELIDYEKKIENKKFNFRELEELVNGFEKDLDNIYEKLDDKITIVDYRLIFQRADSSEIIEFMKGGFDLSVKANREYVLSDFKERYKETFESLLEKTRKPSYPLNIYISVLGFGNKITHEIEAKDPV
ncbi:MAG: hypothetical protein PHH54_04690 [Candidatus Nanoarchaeia archaeon]|nr:hypothetical protein [Candidatus Nanoarchaeia archaeon]MDD5741254.1 hypothetical protein [Candidatus Nanoarchaeia archaeon]